MKLYCQITEKTKENGESYLEITQGPCELPQNSERVSNLNLLDDETLKLFGWVPLIQQTENKPVFVSSTYEIFENKVIENIVTRDKTEEELSSEKEKQNYYQWQQVRKQRDDLLANSDKLILIDNWELLTEEQKIKLKNYRKTLRDIPSTFSDPFSVKFPTL